MSDSRASILSAIRHSLMEGGQRSKAVLDILEERLRFARPEVQPSFEGDLVEKFCEKHVAVHGTFERVTGVDAIVEVVENHLHSHSMTPNILVGAGKMLDLIKWPVDWQVDRRPATAVDRIMVSEAVAGIAETGTLVFVRSPESPTSHLFLAENHLVLLDPTRIVKHQEDAWQQLRSEFSTFPPTVNLITGPSKTGDVEQTIEYGAHGPRHLHLLICNR
jgi:L-lactate dehydrogenase complex protein LldG